MASGGAHDAGSEDRQTGRHPVLEVFGLQLEVSNARLADLLTMDARSALTTDVREIAPAAPAAATSANAAAPVAAAAPEAPDEATVLRQRFRRDVLETGIALGFDVAADGSWRSPLGVTLLTRAFEKPVDAATAAHYVRSLAARPAAGESAVLLVCDGRASTATFAAAIRVCRVHERFRVVCAADLAEIRRLHGLGVVDHRRALVLLAPVADVDAGELLALIRSHAAA